MRQNQVTEWRLRDLKKFIVRKIKGSAPEDVYNLKAFTIPRLELCGALILSQLISLVN